MSILTNPSSSPFHSIYAQHISKAFGRHWVLRDFSDTFSNKQVTVVQGQNGSGKSTLLKILSTYACSSSGQLTYTLAGETQDPQTVFHLIAVAAPWVGLPDEFTVLQLCTLHARFKAWLPSNSTQDILEHCQLRNLQNHKIKDLSAGLTQRLRLALTLLSNSPFCLLDEPCNSLDNYGIEIYQQMLNRAQSSGKLLVVASHREEEWNTLPTALVRTIVLQSQHICPPPFV